MKYVLVILGGAADRPVAALGGRTPLQAARTPALDNVARMGRIGAYASIPPGQPASTEVALLSVLGYDPTHHVAARGPLEALARGLTLGPKDLAFRCNLVTVTDGRLHDFTAGRIASAEAARLLEDLDAALADQTVRFFPGRGYRHLFVWSGVGPGADLRTVDPQGLVGEPIKRHLPRGRDAEPLRQLIKWSQRQLEGHEVNQIRRDLGENPANSLWVYGEGPPPMLPAFSGAYGEDGVLIAGTDLIRGLALAIGWEVVDVAGATGDAQTDFTAKGRAAVRACDARDFVCVHVEGPDEAGHTGDAQGKVVALERIDRDIVAPLALRLEGERARLLVITDRVTPCEKRCHVAEPGLFAIAGHGITSLRGEAFDEATAAVGEMPIERGHELMEYFLRR